MKLITATILAREAPERWASSYRDWRHDESKQEITRRLLALTPEQRTPAAIAAIIGNTSWAEVRDCDECNEPQDAVMQIGQEPNYDSRTVNVCLACITKAHAALTTLGKY